MGKIRVLGETLANKIAAGEVIERPASVVKELVENAIDAHATQIDITIAQGGKELIRVDDNGDGISPDDVLLALERHATSKITRPDDLFSISTLGFRGEALPSIASVSQLTLVTKTADAAAGSLVEIYGGKLVAHKPAGTSQGTSVTVRQLFYNTPARYKFLKTDATERRYILDVVVQLAMAHPEIRFSLTSDQQVLFHTPGDGDMLSVILAAYGREVATAMLPLEKEKDFLQISGYVSHPRVHRSNRKDETIIVNGRVIQSRLLCNAVEKGYQSLLPAHRFPITVLSVKIDTSLVDVNVHPAKAEVRFQDDRQVYKTVLLTVKDALLSHDLIPVLDTKPATLPHAQTFSGRSSVSSVSSSLHLFKQESASLQQSESKQSGKSKAEYARKDRAKLETTTTPGQLREYLQNSDPVLWSYQPPEMVKKIPRSSSANELSSSSIGREYSEPASTRLEDTTLFNGLVPIGQWLNTYILLAASDALWMIDQHIAHERVLYEQLSEAYQNKTASRQPLLMPVQIELAPRERSVLETNLPLLTRLGFAIEEFGGNTFRISEIPLILTDRLANQEITDLIRELLDRWEKGGDRLDELITSMSCRGAVKAGEPLAWPEIERILIQLEQTSNPYTCPHGRPIIVKLSRREVERRFGRR